MVLIAELLVGYVQQDIPVVHINQLCLDSRKLQRGDCFCALAGTHENGRDYIQDAVAKGASCILIDDSKDLKDLSDLVIGAEGGTACPIIKVRHLSENLGKIASRFYDHPSHAMHVIGITGTNGKTTTARTLAACFNGLSKSCASIGTLGVQYLGEAFETNITTPDAISLQRQFASLKEKGAKYLCMEVSSHGLVQGRVSGVAYECAIFTNLTQDHLDYHKTMQAYGEAKKKLFIRQELQCAIINANDPFHENILAETTAAQVITYGIEVPANVMATRLEISQQGMSAHIQTPWGNGQLTTKLLGRFNLSNLLAVLACLLYYQVPLKKALQQISEAQPVVGRMQTVMQPGRPTVIVDYAHTPDAMTQILKAARDHTSAHPNAKLWCVFGCGGDRDTTKRPLMGEIATCLADKVVITSDNPRTEDPNLIIQDILKGDLKYQPEIIIDREQAIAFVLNQAKPEDVIVLSGKGHETYQIIGDKSIPFSDLECVKNHFASTEKLGILN